MVESRVSTSFACPSSATKSPGGFSPEISTVVSICTRGTVISPMSMSASSRIQPPMVLISPMISFAPPLVKSTNILSSLVVSVMSTWGLSPG